MINPQCLELPTSRTNHGWDIEIRLYDKFFSHERVSPALKFFWDSLQFIADMNGLQRDVQKGT